MTRWQCTSYYSSNFGIGLLYEPRPWSGVQKFTAQIGPWAIVLYRESEDRWSKNQAETLHEIGLTLLRTANRHRMPPPP
jgi:hypothetical protein